jgi:LemA protein
MIGGRLAGNYNKLVTSKEAVDQRRAQVDNQLQRRNDLIESGREREGHGAPGAAGVGDIAKRARRWRAHTPEEKAAAGQSMDQALEVRRCHACSSWGREPSAAQEQRSVPALMDELAGTENRLATERMRYNQEVQSYNVAVKRFPNNLYATMFNFKEAPYYQIPEAARAVPKVDMSGLRK